MPKIKFSESFIERQTLPRNQTQVAHYDLVISGLSLVVGKKAKTYYFDLNKKGYKRKRTKLGRTTEITLRQARDEAQRIIDESHLLTTLDYATISVGDYIRDVYAKERPKHSNIKNTRYIDNIVKEKALSKISKADIEDWVQRRILEPKTRFIHQKGGSSNVIEEDAFISVDTAKREYNALRSILNFAVERGHISKSHINGVKFHGLNDSYRQPLSKAQWQQFRNCLDHHPKSYMPIVVKLMMYTGARPGEIYHIKAFNIVYEENYIIVESSFSKTGHTRHLIINDLTKQILRELDEKNKERYQDNPEDWLFFNPRTKGPIKSVNKTWRRMIENNNLPQIAMYTLRHTYATHVLKQTNIVVTKELLGHKDISTTQIYARALDEDKHQAANFITDFMNDDQH